MDKKYDTHSPIFSKSLCVQIVKKAGKTFNKCRFSRKDCLENFSKGIFKCILILFCADIKQARTFILTNFVEVSQ